MLNSYITTSQTLGVNDILEFDMNSGQCGCAIQHIADSTAFQLVKAGFYKIDFNGVASATATTTDPITLQLYNGSDEVAGAVASALSGAVDTPTNLAFSAIIHVRPSCRAVNNTSTLTFRNIGVEAVYSNANVVITKIS